MATEEEFMAAVSRIKSVTDRKGRKQIFVYNVKGQIDQIRDGAPEARLVRGQ